MSIERDWTECPSQSFFKLNVAETFEKLKELDGNEFKLFMFYTLKGWGWDGQTQRQGDGKVRSSSSYAAQGLNLSQKTIEKYNDRLLKKNALSKVRVSRKYGTTFAITPACFVRPMKEPKTKDVTQKPDPKPVVEFGNSYITSSVKTTEPVRQNLPKNIDSRSIDISLSNKNEELRKFEARWQGMLKGEREREQNTLLSLIKERPDEAKTICKAFEIILADQAKLGKIISPIAILKSNYTQYRNRAISELEKGVRLKEQEKAKAEAIRAKEEKELQEEMQYRQNPETVLSSYKPNEPINWLLFNQLKNGSKFKETAFLLESAANVSLSPGQG